MRIVRIVKKFFFIIKAMDALREVYGKIENYFETQSDPRTTNWFLMGSPFPVLAVSLVYVISVQVSASTLKENRKKILEFYI